MDTSALCNMHGLKQGYIQIIFIVFLQENAMIGKLNEAVLKEYQNHQTWQHSTGRLRFLNKIMCKTRVALKNCYNIKNSSSLETSHEYRCYSCALLRIKYFKFLAGLETIGFFAVITPEPERRN